MGISVRDGEEAARKFVAEHGLAYANGRDPDVKIAQAFQVEATPTTFFITPNGEILGRQHGRIPDLQLAQALQTLLDYKNP